MAKTLQLQFETELGQTMNLTLENPLEPVDAEKVKEAMENIIASDAFDHPNGKPAAIKGARVIERNVTVLEV